MKLIYGGMLLILSITLCNCKKYLDTIPDQSLTVPTTIGDLQALLENSFMFQNSPSGPELGADDYYLTYPTWQSLQLVYQNSYIWAPDIYEGSSSVDWNQLYKIVYTCNIVLDGLNKIIATPGNEAGFNLVKGTALFYRAFAFFNLSQEYAKPYMEASATNDPGIPLRLSANLNDKSVRASVKETYNRIIADLQESATLLPAPVQSSNLNHPSRPVVYALLARTCLSMRDYSQAGLYADSSLQLYNTLIDYNTINANALIPFKNTNAETMFQCYMSTGVPVLRGSIATTTLVDTTLYNSYLDNDLRKSIFFRANNNGSHYYKGQYTGGVFLFNGFATDEMYLIRAEAFAREGHTDLAMEDLNTLLGKRWKAGTFIPYTASGPDDAVKEILKERRKELLFRGLRWTDLRRLNQESEFAATLTRILNGQTYTLPPNDPKYVYPIPNDEIVMDGIAQNQR